MKVLKVMGCVFGVLLALGLVIFAGLYFHVEQKRQAKIEFELSTFNIPTDETSIVEGRRLVQVKACADCHGQDLAGKTFINEPPIGQFSGSNLTRGKGSRVLEYQDRDWIRSIRYGIGSDGRPLIAMPAGDFHGISNEDLGKMIAYIKTVPAVDRESLPQKIGPVSRLLYSFGQMPLIFPFEEVRLDDTPVEKVSASASPEYGKYVAIACTGCHGPGFGGGHIPGTPPNWPDAKNLTMGGRFAKWSKEDFKKVLTTGLTPDGHQIDPQYMPWKSTAAMNDVEVEALFQYLKQLPAKVDGTR